MALKRICELSVEEQEHDASRRGVNHILNVLIPKFLHHFKQASPNIRYCKYEAFSNSLVLSKFYILVGSV